MDSFFQNAISSDNRLSYIDNMKGLCILAITLLHYEDGLFPNWLNTFIGCFMISGFYITNGWLHGQKKENKVVNIKSFLQKRFRSLGSPYLWFSVIILCFDVIFYLIGHINVQIIYRDIYKTCVLKGIGTLWFLPVIFMGELLFMICSNPIIRKYCTALCLFIIIPLIDVIQIQIINYFSPSVAKLILAPFSVLSNGLFAFLAISLSFYASKIIINLRILQLYICLMPVIALLFYLKLLNIIEIGYIESILDSICYVLIPLHLLLLFKVFEHKNSVLLNYLNFWGRNSLILMLTHYSIIMEFCIYINCHVLGNSSFSNWNSIFFFIITMIFEYPLTLFINKRLRFLLGK